MQSPRKNSKEVPPFKWGTCLLLAMVIGCSPPTWRRQMTFRPYSPSDRTAAAGWQEAEARAVPNPVMPSSYQLAPPAIFTTEAIEFRDVSLDEVIRIAFTNSQVLRDLGGRLVSQPTQAVTQELGGIAYSDPQAGVAAALAAFDAQWIGTFKYSKTQNGLRAPIIGSTITEIQQTRGEGSLGIAKIGQAGTRFSLTNGTLFDADNIGVPPNRFGRNYDAYMKFETRHPLMRGGGRTYNAIAGPNSPFGFYNGYWIAGLRSEIATDDIQIAFRDYAFTVIRMYWLLQFSYANMEVRREALAIAKETMEAAKSKRQAGIVDQDFVLQATQHFLEEEHLYEEAVAGAPERLLSGILGPGGSLISGSDFGYRAQERRLRLLIGLSNGQGGLLRPIDTPSTSPILFDYHDSLSSAFAKRQELLRQSKVVEMKKMELVAARNLRLPTVDLLGSYRLHGFGEKLIGDRNIPEDSATNALFRGEQQDVTAGVELIRPAGNRLAKTAHQNAMLNIAREVAILDQQQLQISHEITGALAELERSQRALRSADQRLEIMQVQVGQLKEKFDQGLPLPLESLLQARKAATEMQLAVAIAKIDYANALIGLSLARGTLMEEINVFFHGQDPNSPDCNRDAIVSDDLASVRLSMPKEHAGVLGVPEAINERFSRETFRSVLADASIVEPIPETGQRSDLQIALPPTPDSYLRR